jgi:putative oxidoreductase
MNAILGRYSSYIYAILRIVVGFLFMLHGTQKFFGWPPSSKPGGGALAGLALAGAVIELVGGFMIMVGFFGSIAAFIASGTMAVAYFGWHQPNGTLPIQNGGELAVVYCFVFLYIAAAGSGTWSVDGLMGKRKTG